MQILPSGQYNVLDDLARNPNATVTVQRNYDSIPFEGKHLQNTLTNEKTPKHILNTDGRLCLVYTKYVTTDAKTQLYYKITDTARLLWETSVKLTTGLSYDYFSPACIQINSSTDIGIIVSRNGTDLFSCIVDVDGVIKTALADTTINGTNPSLTIVGSTYWLAYERSGIIYYRTSSDFITWTAEVNFNTITGLSNDHSVPYIYYDTSDNLWLTFERVTDAVASPVVKNVYTMISDDNGVSWDSPVAQTALIAGQGSAVNPSIVDSETHRYINYTLEQQLQNNQEPALGATGTQRDFIADELQNRVGMLTGQSYSSGSNFTIYDRGTGTYTNHDLKAHGLTDNTGLHLAYDPVNHIWAIGTYNNGIIVYNEDTTAWTTYNETSTPAIHGDHIWATTQMLFEDAKLYFMSYNNTYKVQMLNVSAGTVTDLKTVTGLHQMYQSVFFSSDDYIVHVIRANNIWDFTTESPTVTVYNKSSLAELYTEKMLLTGNYKSRSSYDSAAHVNWWYSKFGWDDVNNNIYTLATDTTATDDSGIAKVPVGASALGTTVYYSQADGNPTGLFPNPDPVANKVAFVGDLVFNSTNQRLYIWQGTTSHASSGLSDYLIHVFNADTAVIIESYAATNTDAWLANWSTLDASLIKVLQSKSYPYLSVTQNSKTSSDDKEVIYGYGTVSGNRYFWAILSTEGFRQRVYYRKTADDLTWTTQSYLTTDSKDDNCNLGYSDGRLKAFWHRNVNGISELKWDEDLSTEADISEYVRNFEINMTDETGANNAEVSFADKGGVFNPLNYNSLKYDYFLENNIIKIFKGNAGEVTPAFTGLIASGGAKYTRGSNTLYTIKVYDKAKNWFKSKITSAFYENKTIDYIVEDIITSYGGLSAGEYSLPTIGETIPKVQFIEEYIMDILYKLYQAYGYFPYFDEEGILKAREVNYDATTDFTYYEEGTDTVDYNKAPAFNVIDFNHTWSDDTFVNKVTVIGQTEETFETEFDEEFMGFLQGSAGWFSTKNSFTFYFSEDKALNAVNPRLEVVDSATSKFFGGGENLSTAGAGKQTSCTINQNVTNQTAILYSLIAGSLIWTIIWGEGLGVVAVYNGLAPVLAIALTVLGQISSFYYEIYAQPVGEAAPQSIEITVEDKALITKYGEILKEIDNPFLETAAKCIALADLELEKASWFRYQPQLRLLSNMAHQTQDVIEVFNPVTNLSYKMYIKEIRRSYTRGEEDIDQITCALIQ